MRWFTMTKEEYGEYVKKKSPNSKTAADFFKAWLVGGAICCLGQGLMLLYDGLGAAESDCALWTTVSLVFLGTLFTGLGLYDDLAAFGGAGTLVPVTGFANAVASPALEFKTEGLVTGTGARMFTIAGPVIVYGAAAATVYGIVYWAVTQI